MKKLVICFWLFIFLAFSLTMAQEVKVKISEVSAKKITFPLGSKDGVARETKGRILHLITNQLTGKSVEVPIGKFSVAEVGENQSIGTVYDLAPGWQISSKDMVVLDVSSTQVTPEEPVNTPETPVIHPSNPPSQPAQPILSPVSPTLPGGIPRPTKYPPSIGVLKGEELSTPGKACSLTVSTNPVSVMVYVDRRLIGDSPVTVENLAPGRHLVRAVQAPNYGPYIEEIELTADKKWELTINIEPSTEAQLRAGKEAYEKGDLKTASEDLLKAASYLPMQSEALLYLGYVYQDSGDLNDALSMYQAYAAFVPDSLAMRIRMGEIYSLQRNWSKALTSYKLGVLALSEFQGVTDKLPSASDFNVRNYQSLVAAHPNNLNYRLILACLYEKKGKMKEGSSELKTLIKKYLKTNDL